MSSWSTRIVRLPLFQSSAMSPAWPGFCSRRLGGQFGMQRGVAAAHAFDPPFEDVADRRLPGLDVVEARQDAALDDAADAGNVGHRLVARKHANVAGRGSDHLDQRALADAAADRAVMDVELADRDRDSRGEAELGGPLGAERAGRRAGVIGLVVKPVAKAGEARIERAEELLVGQAAPCVGVERLVAGGADAALDLHGIGHAGQHRGNPVRDLDPRIGRLEHGGGDVQAPPDLRPEPFRGIDAAAFGDVLRADLAR